MQHKTPDNESTCRPADNAGTPGRPEIYPPGKPDKPGVTPPHEPPSKEPHRPEITPVREPPSGPPRSPKIKPGKHRQNAASTPSFFAGWRAMCASSGAPRTRSKPDSAPSFCGT